MMGYKICDYAHQMMGFLDALIGNIGGKYEKRNSKQDLEHTKWWLETYNP